METKQALLTKLDKIFSDGVVDDAERSSLRAALASGELSHQELREVFKEFVSKTWSGTIEDGRVTEAERHRLRAIVRVLGLDASDVPKEWRSALSAD